MSKPLKTTFPIDYQFSLIIFAPLEEQVGDVVALREDSQPWDEDTVEIIKF